MKNPLISVIVPCYNQAQFLSETLQSVLKQTYSHWECIIVNDGSPDNTEEIAKIYCEKDNRFKYIYKENGGLSSARNAGINIATGDFIQFLDSDDIILPQKFEVQLKNFPKETGIAISSYMILKKNSSKPLVDKYLTHSVGNLREDILFQWDNHFSIPIHTALFRNDYFFKHEIRFKENLKAKEDWVFWVECTQINALYKKDDIVLAYYRKHGNSMTKNKLLMFENTFDAFFMVLDIISDERLKNQLKEKLKNASGILFIKYWKGKVKYNRFFNIMVIVNFFLLIGLILLLCKTINV